jgi:hypothetical protein
MRSRAILVVVAGALLASALLLLRLANSPPPSVDPAFVDLVYARHYATYNAFFWNTHDGNFDGFASFLDVVIKGLLGKVSAADPVRDAQLLTIGFVIASAAAGAAFSARAARDAGSSDGRTIGLGLLGALAFGSSVALVHGASFLLETPLFVTLAIASLGVLLFGRRESRLARALLFVIGFLLVLVRPEGLPIAVLHVGLWVLLARAEGSSWRGVRAPPISFALFTTGYLVWRYAYFGHLAPVDPRGGDLADHAALGARYVGDFFSEPRRGVTHLLVVAAAALVLAARAPWTSTVARRRAVVAAASSLVAFVSVILEGGEAHPGGRLLAMPIAFAIAAAVLAAAGLAGRWRQAAVAALALFSADAILRVASRPGERLARIREWPITSARFACERSAVEAIASRARTFAETDMARAKFYADDLRVDDRRGEARLDDAVSTGDDVIQLGVYTLSSKPMAARAIDEILADDRTVAKVFGRAFSSETKKTLHDRYVPASIPTCKAWFNVFVRRESAARFEGGDILVGAPEPE